MILHFFERHNRGAAHTYCSINQYMVYFIAAKDWIVTFRYNGMIQNASKMLVV